jgi:hypothetical protein
MPRPPVPTRLLPLILLVPTLSGCCLGEIIGASIGDAINIGFHSSDAIDIAIPGLDITHGCPKVFPQNTSEQQFLLVIDGTTIEGIRAPSGGLEFIMFGAFRLPPDQFWYQWIFAMGSPWGDFFQDMAAQTSQQIVQDSSRRPIESFHPPAFFDMYFCVAHLDIFLLLASRSDDPSIRQQARSLYLRVRTHEPVPFNAIIFPDHVYTGTFTLLPHTKSFLDQIFSIDDPTLPVTNPAP